MTEREASGDEVLLFAKGEVLYALVETAKPVAAGLREMARGSGHRYFVPIHLDEELFLVKRRNSVELGGCKCHVNFPKGRWRGISLNHAYTEILHHYKPHLNAFTGNAFRVIHFEQPAPREGDLFPTLAPLSFLRDQRVAKFREDAALRAAVSTALSFHGQQVRRGGSIPYISHLLAVAAIVLENGGTTDQAIAALLHDTLDEERIDDPLAAIRTRFSSEVADIVADCADTLERPKPEWKVRKERFLGRIPQLSPGARLVIAADKLHNARSILTDLRRMGDKVWERFSGKKEGTLWYYRALAEQLKKSGPLLISAEFASVVEEIERVASAAGPAHVDGLDRLKTETDYEQLNRMVGVEPLKRVIERDIGLALHNQRLRQIGLDATSQPKLSMIFLGNPGTGKTKAARLIGSIYRSLGLLSKGHVVEVSRKDLVGDVIGATEKRTAQAVEKALGGVLFVDEAYALKKAGGNDFGLEAIEVLLKAMTDIPGDFCVIVAGYPAPMNKFLDANPGLRSRFGGREVLFPDFPPEELVRIAKGTVKKMHLQMSADAEQFLEDRLREQYRNRSATFGNARYVNSVIQEARASLAQRLRSLPAEPTYDQLTTLILEDVKSVYERQLRAALDVPIDEPLLDQALRQLHALVGVDEVKTEIRELSELVRYHRSIGKDPRSFLSSHFVFTGNPGTGKTTVARIVAQIFRALGLLERGHLVECDRQALVAEYIGHTAIKTNQLIDNAIGGVLFIDEAYSLVSETKGDFGREAIQVLLKRMEDQRGQFVVIVAGYPEEMEEFLASNPGLKSRFDTNFLFSDYGKDDLVAIAKSIFAEEGLQPDQDALRLIERYFVQYVQTRDRFSGNARDVRNLVKKSVRNQNLRLAHSTGAAGNDRA